MKENKIRMKRNSTVGSVSTQRQITSSKLCVISSGGGVSVKRDWFARSEWVGPTEGDI